MSVAVWVGVALLGGVGAVARFLVDHTVVRRLPGDFPSGIFVVNVSGALLLGLVHGLAPNSATSTLVGVALLGSYTTFSTWMLQTLELGERRRIRLAVANVVISLAFGLTAAWAGQQIGLSLR